MVMQDDIVVLLCCIDYCLVDLCDVDLVVVVVFDLVYCKCVSYFVILLGLYIFICEGLVRGGVFVVLVCLMLEKLIGSDSESVEEIISIIGQWIDEDCVFCFDYYLGKVVVQNLIVLCFGNMLLEVVWNCNYIELVYILVVESEGVDGCDVYYVCFGVLCDMVQSYILQLLCMVVMELLVLLEVDCICDEKVKVLCVFCLFDVKYVVCDSIRGCYIVGIINGQLVQVYQLLEGSDVEIFVGVIVYIDNWCWSGVLFYLVIGKCLFECIICVVVMLKLVIYWLFECLQCVQVVLNCLVFQLQLQENIELGLMSSLVGLEWGVLELYLLELELLVLIGLYCCIVYECLFLDVFNGNYMLFVCDDEVCVVWVWIDSVVDVWKDVKFLLEFYFVG